MDHEPEYIAVNAAGTKAYVTLQEANAIGVLDLGSNTFSKIVGLGTKDFSAAGNAIDPSHKDGKVELRSAAVRGLYQPDGIAAYQAGGQTYLVMANEGDTREDDGDKARVKDVAALNATAPADLKQLNVSTTDSTSGTDLVTFGGRSFSIRDEDGNLVFDSGSRLDAEAIARGIYDDGRSDDKGVEPEGVALKQIGGRQYAFIGLERTTKGAVAIAAGTGKFPTLASLMDGTWDLQGWISFQIPNRTTGAKRELAEKFLLQAQDPAILASITDLKNVAAAIPGGAYSGAQVMRAQYLNNNQCAPLNRNF